eukprot:s719_g30.t1
MFEVWASSTTIYLGYTSCKKALHLRSPAKPNIRPAFLSGCLWALGFACFAKSLDDIGYTATYVLSVIGPVLVSSLVSVFIFKEVEDQLARGRTHRSYAGLRFPVWSKHWECHASSWAIERALWLPAAAGDG